MVSFFIWQSQIIQICKRHKFLLEIDIFFGQEGIIRLYSGYLLCSLYTWFVAWSEINDLLWTENLNSECQQFYQYQQTDWLIESQIIQICKRSNIKVRYGLITLLAGNMGMIDTSNSYMSIQPQNYNMRSTESNVEVLVDQPLEASRSEGNITENKTRQHINL
jgi:hypothetical protein